MSVSASPARRPLSGARAQRPELQVVHRTRRRGRFAALLLVVAAIGVFGIVSLNAVAARAAFQAQDLEADVDALELRYDELSGEVATLESPERVRDIAVRDLGMVPAPQPGFLVVGSGTGAPAPPPPAPQGTPAGQGPPAPQVAQAARGAAPGVPSLPAAQR